MSSVGVGPATTKNRSEIAAGWRTGLAGIEHIVVVDENQKLTCRLPNAAQPRLRQAKYLFTHDSRRGMP